MRRGRKHVHQTYLFSASKSPDPKRVVGALLDGVDIILVDPNLYSQLTPVLEQFRDKYEDKKEVKVLEKIDFLMDYIEKYPERQALTEKLIGPPKTARVRPPPLTREQLQSEVDEILKHDVQKQYNHDEYQQIIGEMRNIRSKYISIQDFANASLYDDRMKCLIMQCESLQTLKMAEQNTTEMQDRLNAAEEALADMQLRWERVIQNFQNDKIKSIEQLEKEQDEEYQQMAERLESKKPKTLPSMSNHMLQLKRLEKSLVNAKDYEGADKVKAKIMAYEEVERSQLIDKWEKSNRAALKELCRRQDRIYSIKVANLKRDEKKLKDDMEKELHAAKTRVETLKRLLRKNEDLIYSINPSLGATNNDKNTLPTLKQSGRRNETPQNAFRQRALLNMKIYTRRPPKTARATTRH